MLAEAGLPPALITERLTGLVITRVVERLLEATASASNRMVGGQEELEERVVAVQEVLLEVGLEPAAVTPELARAVANQVAAQVEVLASKGKLLRKKCCLVM